MKSIHKYYIKAIELQNDGDLFMALLGLMLQKILLFLANYTDQDGVLRFPSMLNIGFVIKAAGTAIELGKMVSIFVRDKQLFQNIYLNPNTIYQKKIKRLELNLNIKY